MVVALVAPTHMLPVPFGIARRLLQGVPEDILYLGIDAAQLRNIGPIPVKELLR